MLEFQNPFVRDTCLHDQAKENRDNTSSRVSAHTLSTLVALTSSKSITSDIQYSNHIERLLLSEPQCVLFRYHDPPKKRGLCNFGIIWRVAASERAEN